MFWWKGSPLTFWILRDSYLFLFSPLFRVQKVNCLEISNNPQNNCEFGCPTLSLHHVFTQETQQVRQHKRTGHRQDQKPQVTCGQDHWLQSGHRRDRTGLYVRNIGIVYVKGICTTKQYSKFLIHCLLIVCICSQHQQKVERPHQIQKERSISTHNEFCKGAEGL